jgi:filamentous hemagglutinin family protein
MPDLFRYSAMTTLVGAIALSINTPIYAQLVPDERMGSEQSIVNSNVLIDGILSDRIDGGATRGRNLFHSFREFNVNDGQRVYFNTPAGIETIFSRVTGSNASFILGTLGTVGNADLFLLNPNGILFGPNAQLDVRGSFLATTANGIQFGDQGFFSTANPEAPPLLTVNPSALFFNQQTPAAIFNASAAPAGLRPSGLPEFGLRVPDGESLLLVGGNILMDGGRLNALGGRIELTGLAAPGAIALNTSDGWRLTLSPNSPLADVSLVNNSRVSVRGTGGGDIVVNANRLVGTNRGRFNAGTEGAGSSGTLILNANNIQFAGFGSGVGNGGLENSTGNVGDIIINARSLELDEEAQIANTVEEGGTGRTGNILINTDTLTLRDGSSILMSGVAAGGMTINARSFTADNGVRIISRGGNSLTTWSGDIDVSADEIALRDDSRIIQSGNAREGIAIDTRTLLLQNTALGTTSVNAEGSSGNVRIRATESITLTGSQIGTSAGGGLLPGETAPSTVSSGDIAIATPRLTLDTISVIRSGGTFTLGRSGNIVIDAPQAVNLFGESSLESASLGGTGGNITIETGNLTVNQGSNVFTSSSDPQQALRDFLNGSFVNDPDYQFYGRALEGFIAIATQSGQLDALSQGRSGNLIIRATNAVEIDGMSLDNTATSSLFTTSSAGDAGDVTIQARSFRLSSGGIIEMSTTADGRGGDVNITAEDVVIEGFTPRIPIPLRTRLPSYISTNSNANATGDAGNITIMSDRLTLQEGAQIGSDTDGSGRGGDVRITAREWVTIRGPQSPETPVLISRIDSSTSSTGQAGDVALTTRRLELQDGGIIEAGTQDAGQGGNITVSAEDIVISGIRSALTTANLSEAIGSAGNITLTTHNLTLQQGGVIISNTFGAGRGGDIRIDARDSVTLRGIETSSNSAPFPSSITSGTSGSGSAGNLFVAANRLQIQQGAVITTDSTGEGQGGNITIRAANGIVLDGIGQASDGLTFRSTLSSEAAGNGSAGDIVLSGDRLSVQNGALISASTFANGTGGTIRINADRLSITGQSSNGQFNSAIASEAASSSTGNAGSILLNVDQTQLDDQGVLSTNTFGIGRAGNISLRGDRLSILGGGRVSANTSASGTGGTIRLNVDQIDVAGLSRDRQSPSSIRTQTLDAATGNAGNILVETERMNLRHGGLLSTSTTSQGNAGNVVIRAAEAIAMTGTSNGVSSGIFSSTTNTSQGQGGNITIAAPNVRISQGAVINARTDNARNGGNIRIRTNSLTALDGGQIITSTRGSGLAGSIRLDVLDTLLLSGRDSTFAQRSQQFGRERTANEGRGESGLFASTLSNSSGNGGSIALNAERIRLNNQAQIAVDSQGGGQGGSITGQTGTLRLGSRSAISASTASNNGGNVSLRVARSLLMRDRSNITAEAGTRTGAGNGGNIILNAPLIVAVPNEDSNINANANLGNGGNIDITTQSLLGLQPREIQTPLSDITASSRFGLTGSITISSPDVDPNRGLVELPTTVVDASQQIAQTCSGQGGSDVAGEFVVTGRGGLPPNPTTPPVAQSLQPRLATLDEVTPAETGPLASIESSAIAPSVPPVIEAQGWTVASDGTIHLVKAASTVTPNALNSASTCRES